MNAVEKICTLCANQNQALHAVTGAAYAAGFQGGLSEQAAVELGRRMQSRVREIFAKADTSNPFGKVRFQSSAPKAPHIPTSHARLDASGVPHMRNLRETGVTKAGNATIKITKHDHPEGQRFGVSIEHDGVTHSIGQEHHQERQDAAAYLGANVVKHLAKP